MAASSGCVSMSASGSSSPFLNHPRHSNRATQRAALEALKRSTVKGVGKYPDAPHARQHPLSHDQSASSS